MNVLRMLLASRKVWVGGATVLLTALVLKFGGPALGLAEDQCLSVAQALLAAGIAIIVGIAYEDGKEKGAVPLDDTDEPDGN